ncbi:hypothetical protein GGH92_008416, partial [Coemansia sp. RSA 2673]
MLKSLGVQLLKPRFSPRFLIRNFSADSNTPGNKKSDIAASAEIKESMQEQIDRLISPAASSGPGKVYENSEYSRVYFPKTTYHPHELDEGYAQKAMEKAA